MKNVKRLCAIALSLLFVALSLVGCTPSKFEEIFYCTSTASCSIRSFDGVVSLQDYGYNYYVAPVQKATRSHAEYRAVKVAEDKGKTAQYEIRDKYTNELLMLIEYDADGKVLNFTELGLGPKLKYTYEYNEDGTLGKILLTSLTRNETYTWVQFEYDANGRCIHSEQYGYSSTMEQRISNDMTYEYSDDGKTVKIIEYNSINDANSDNPQKNSYMYEYDDEGKIIKRTILDDEGKETDYILCEYKDSLLCKETFFVYNSYLDEMQEHIYAPHLYLRTKWSTGDWAGTMLSRPIHEYDEAGRVTKTYLQKPEDLVDVTVRYPGTFFEFIYEYDSLGNTTRETVVRDGETILSVQYEYDKSGLCTQSKAYDGNNQLLMENNGYIHISAAFYPGNGNSYDFNLYLELFDAEQGEAGDFFSYGVTGTTLSQIQ